MPFTVLQDGDAKAAPQGSGFTVLQDGDHPPSQPAPGFTVLQDGDTSSSAPNRGNTTDGQSAPVPVNPDPFGILGTGQQGAASASTQSQGEDFNEGRQSRSGTVDQGPVGNTLLAGANAVARSTAGLGRTIQTIRETKDASSKGDFFDSIVKGISSSAEKGDEIVPEGLSKEVGHFGGSLAFALSAGAVGGAPLQAAEMASEAYGNSLNEVDSMRAHGANISDEAAQKYAIGQGLINLVLGYAGGKTGSLATKALGKVFGPALADAAAAGDKAGFQAIAGKLLKAAPSIGGAVAGGAAENAAANTATNALAQQTIDPSRPLTQGLKEATIVGGALPLGGAIHEGLAGRSSTPASSPPENAGNPVAVDPNQPFSSPPPTDTTPAPAAADAQTAQSQASVPTAGPDLIDQVAQTPNPNRSDSGASEPVAPTETPSDASSPPVEAPVSPVEDQKSAAEKRLDIGRSGMVNVDPLFKFIPEDVIPAAKKAIGGVVEAKDDIQSLLAPQTKGAQARQTGNLIREMGATRAQSNDRAAKALDGASKFFDSQDPQFNLKVMDDIESGTKSTDPKLSGFTQQMRDILDSDRADIQSLGKGHLEDFNENYFPHIWERPDQAGGVFASILSKRPLEGSKGFLKERKFPTIAEGIQAGLKPVSTNPVDLVLLKHNEIQKYVLAQRLLSDFKDRGLVKYIPAGEQAPDGFAKINDKIATVNGPREGAVKLPPTAGASQMVDPNQVQVFGRRIMGEYMAPTEVAGVLNNYLSPGYQGKAAYRLIRYTSNLLNQAQLGASAFHLGFTSTDAAVSQLGLGLKQVLEGRPVEGIKSAAKTPAAPFQNFLLGNKVLKEWMSPGTQGAEIAKIVDSVRQAGGRARTDAMYRTDAIQSMMKAFRQGNLTGGVLRLPAAISDAVSKPILEYVVPRQKLGMFSKMAQYELEKAGPNANADDVRAALAKAWDSADNRMGQMVYDNLFWDRRVKDSMMIATRSLGWNLGTARELGGGLLDFGKAGLAPLRGKSPEFTHRMAYTLALPVMTGLIGSVINYMNTGEAPHELKDAFFPKTGGKDENGNDARMSLPTYMKDVYAYVKHPIDTVVHKANPIFGVMMDMLENKDFYGTKIHNEDDPLMQKILDNLKFAGKQATPFSIQGAMKSSERGESFGKQAASFVGVTAAPSYVSDQSPAESVLRGIADDNAFTQARTQDQADRSKLKHDLVLKYRQGDRSAAVEAIRDKLLTHSDLLDVQRRGRVTALQDLAERADNPERSIRALEVASPEERRQLLPILTRQVQNSQTLQPEKKRDLLRQLRSVSR